MLFIVPELFKAHLEGTKLKCPDNYRDFDPMEFPHFAIFLQLHLNNPAMDIESIPNNANIIAKIPIEKLEEGIMVQELVDMGVNLGFTNFF